MGVAVGIVRIEAGRIGEIMNTEAQSFLVSASNDYLLISCLWFELNT